MRLLLVATALLVALSRALHSNALALAVSNAYDKIGASARKVLKIDMAIAGVNAKVAKLNDDVIVLMKDREGQTEVYMADYERLSAEIRLLSAEREAHTAN